MTGPNNRITIENARLIFRDFTGERNKFNSDRTFGVVPKIVLVNGKERKQTLDEKTVGILDWITIESADLIIRPFNYEFNGRTGTKAYLSTLYVTKATDTLEEKYADIPDDDEEMPWGENS